MKRAFFVLMAAVLVLSALTACGATPVPETVIQTVEVEKQVTVVETVEVEKEVEKEVIVTQEVEKEVIKEVEKNLVIYNSMHSDPEPREMDAE